MTETVHKTKPVTLKHMKRFRNVLTMKSYQLIKDQNIDYHTVLETMSKNRHFIYIADRGINYKISAKETWKPPAAIQMHNAISFQFIFL